MISCKPLRTKKPRRALKIRLGWMREMQMPLWGIADEIMKFYAPDVTFEKKLGSWSWCEGSKGDYTIRYLKDHFDELLQFPAFARMHPVAFRALKNTFERIARSETRSHNTFTELKYGLPQFVDEGIERVVLVSDYPHFSRCVSHAGQVIEELNLEDRVEIVAEHSFYRHPNQKLSGVKVFEPEIDPRDGIQLGDLATQLFKVKNRSGFKEEYEALIEKFSA